jgi:hypothetical protein
MNAPIRRRRPSVILLRHSDIHAPMLASAERAPSGKDAGNSVLRLSRSEKPPIRNLRAEVEAAFREAKWGRT